MYNPRTYWTYAECACNIFLTLCTSKMSYWKSTGIWKRIKLVAQEKKCRVESNYHWMKRLRWRWWFWRFVLRRSEPASYSNRREESPEEDRERIDGTGKDLETQRRSGILQDRDDRWTVTVAAKDNNMRPKGKEKRVFNVKARKKKKCFLLGCD